METFLPITYLNDFVFCPYSIYLHQVFEGSFEDVYSAAPQQIGKANHSDIDTTERKESVDNLIVKGIYVVSTKLGVYGKIDTYYPKAFSLIERKYKISKIYRGYDYQIWAQYFALREMGYRIDTVSFQTIVQPRAISVQLPGEIEFEELKQHIRKIARFNFESFVQTNTEKCTHCIYASLCDKTQQDHVYT